MKRHPLLIALLALLLAACGSDGAADATATPTATREATEEATPTEEPTEEPAETDDGGSGSDTALEDLIPDELNGVARTDIPGMDQMIASALQQQGMNAGDAEFIFTSYGDVEGGGLVLTAFRIPGVEQVQLETLARFMSGAQGAEGVEGETVDIGGKSVLRISSTQAGQEGTVLLYFAGDAAFTIVAEDTSLAEQLLAELP